MGLFSNIINKVKQTFTPKTPQVQKQEVKKPKLISAKALIEKLKPKPKTHIYCLIHTHIDT